MNEGMPGLGAEYRLGAPLPPLAEQQRAARDAIIEADSPADWEEIGCPCGAPAADAVLSEVDRHGLPARNVICAWCGLVRLSPRWREDRYRRFYEREYRQLYNPSPLSKPDYARWVADTGSTLDRAAWIQAVWRRHRGTAPACVVEIGAGGGWNLSRLPREWTRIGYDVDEAYLAIGRELFGLDMRRGFTTQALAGTGAADIVLLSHVIEHLPDPSGTLRAIGSTAGPESLILIEVPGIFRLHRTNLDPRSYLQNAHTFTFCAATLSDVCSRGGLEVIELDESARAVCRRGAAAASTPQRPGLASRIVTYLRRCDFGYRHYRRLRAVPWAGRALASAWRHSWFAAVGVVSGRSASGRSS